jgi:hypothetical protein
MFKIYFPLFLVWFVMSNIGIGQTSVKQSFEEFRIIRERNIFDPLRREPQKEVRTPPREETTPPEQIRLLGVLLNGKETTIFFEGSQSSYNGEWKRGDIIAGFRIREAQTNGVILENKDQKINLLVGSIITKNNRDEWEIGVSQSYSTKTPEREKTTNSDTKNEGANDILKKLIERRRQETGQ